MEFVKFGENAEKWDQRYKSIKAFTILNLYRLVSSLQSSSKAGQILTRLVCLILTFICDCHTFYYWSRSRILGIYSGYNEPSRRNWDIPATSADRNHRLRWHFQVDRGRVLHCHFFVDLIRHNYTSFVTAVVFLHLHYNIS